MGSWAFRGLVWRKGDGKDPPEGAGAGMLHMREAEEGDTLGVSLVMLAPVWRQLKGSGIRSCR